MEQTARPATSCPLPTRGPYRLVYCRLSGRSHHLGIEVDVESHEDMERDHRRDQWFLANGWTVLRFMDREVINETAYVAEVIIAALLDTTTATIHLAQIHASRGLPPTKVPP